MDTVAALVLTSLVSGTALGLARSDSARQRMHGGSTRGGMMQGGMLSRRTYVSKLPSRTSFSRTPSFETHRTRSTLSRWPSASQGLARMHTAERYGEADEAYGDFGAPDLAKITERLGEEDATTLLDDSRTELQSEMPETVHAQCRPCDQDASDKLRRAITDLAAQVGAIGPGESIPAEHMACMDQVYAALVGTLGVAICQNVRDVLGIDVSPHLSATEIAALPPGALKHAVAAASNSQTVTDHLQTSFNNLLGCLTAEVYADIQ